MRILVADDHPLYREAVRTQIERMFAGAIVDEAASLSEALAVARAEASALDLILLDFHMPGMSLNAVPDIVKSLPHVPIAVISGVAEPADIRATIRAGARGFLPKTATGRHFEHAIQLLLAGGTSVPAEMLLDPPDEAENSAAASAGQPGTVAPDPPWLVMLTTREMEVLREAGRGLSNKEIGRRLDLAESTVKLHLRGIFRKTGAHSRSEVAVMASKAGLL